MTAEPENFDPKIKKQIVDSIRRYPTLFSSCMDVLNQMLVVNGSGYEWDHKGELINVCYGDRKCQLSEEYAEELNMLGDVNHYCHFSDPYDKGSPLWLIPNNVTKEWLDVIQYFCERVNRIDYKAYKLQTLAYQSTYYSLENPNIYEWYDRSMRNFDELRKHTDTLCKKYKWEWMTTKNLHDPNKKKARGKSLSKIIREILDEADGKVPGAIQAIQKREASEYIRRYGVDIFKEVIKEMEVKKNCF